MSNTTTTRLQGLQKTPLGRIVLTGVLVLLLQIPILKISGVIEQRSQSRDDAIADIAGKWGHRQALVGPYLVVPYKYHWIETDPQGKKIPRESIREAQFLPETLSIDGETRSETRHRGIFEVPVYRADLRLKGRFTRPSFEEWSTQSKDILWDRARLVMRISDPRAISSQLAVLWNGDTLAFLPGTGCEEQVSGVHAPLKGHLRQKEFEFSLAVALNGSDGLSLAPFAEHTDVRLQSNWPHPSFQGNWLPREHSVDAAGFTASWSISHLGRNYPQKMQGMEGYKQQIQMSEFGVDFISPVDTYRVTDRLVKYALLFLGLTFITLWLFELMSQLRVHPVQYLLVGSAMCLFYLLQLSLAEHLGLLRSYLIASSAVTGLVSAYCLSVLKSPGRAGIIGSVLALLYGYLYVLLQVQDYALLIGSVGLFVTLAIVMYVTRRIDWYRAYKEDTADTSDTATKTR